VACLRSIGSGVQSEEDVGQTARGLVAGGGLSGQLLSGTSGLRPRTGCAGAKDCAAIGAGAEQSVIAASGYTRRWAWLMASAAIAHELRPDRVIVGEHDYDPGSWAPLFGDEEIVAARVL
jgi:hypothetical protein